MGNKARVELVLDCAAPKGLAKFWREALDYRDYYTDANLAVLVPKAGIASTAAPLAATQPQPGKRYLRLTFDGICAQAGQPLPLPAPHLGVSS
jgi:hypothetical protein